MKINKFILLILLGVIVFELNAKPRYRIETWVYRGETYYLPQRKVKFTIKKIRLPFRVWKSGSYPFTNKIEAEQIIKNWKEDEQAKKEFKQSLYFEIE
jgi:hypothetical protein